MSEMIERVAGRVYMKMGQLGIRDFCSDAPFAEQEGHIRDIFHALARDAIGAAREPTAEMCEAGSVGPTELTPATAAKTGMAGVVRA